MRPMVLAIVLAALVPSWAAAAGDGRERSCAEVLAAPPAAHPETPTVAEVIFHHVTDSTVLSLESPFSHHALELDFKRLGCRMFGWNGLVHLGGFSLDLTVTKHTFYMWLAALLLILLFWSSSPKKGQLVPRGVGSLLELVVVFIRNEIARKNIGGKEGDRYTPFLLTIFFFILAMNLLGLIPYGASATSNIAVTLGLSLMTFVLTQVAGIRAVGLLGWFKHLTAGVHWLLWPIMIPVEVLGLFTKPFALTIRLFANMVAGHIIIYFLIGLIFIMKTAALAPVSVAFAFAIYLLEIFVSLVQAYIFTMLSALFIGFGVSMGHHDDPLEGEGSHGEAPEKHPAHP